MAERGDYNELMRAIGRWIKELRRYPGFAEWKRKTISLTLTHDDPIFGEKLRDLPESEFPFPDLIAKQHALIMSYLGLSSTHSALSDTEFYFRRFPFGGLPVSHDAHLRYICEMYFSRIYEFSERMKRCLNLANNLFTGSINAGPLIKLYAKEFSQELKYRNLIHHHERFDDIAFDKIALLGIMAESDKQGNRERGWSDEYRIAYRRASKEWADRARRRSKHVEAYLNAIAGLLLEQCKFLDDPIQAGPRVKPGVTKQ